MKLTFGPGVDRTVRWTTLQLNQEAVMQGMAFQKKPVAIPCDYDERLRRRAAKRRQNKARAVQAAVRRRRR